MLPAVPRESVRRVRKHAGKIRLHGRGCHRGNSYPAGQGAGSHPPKSGLARLSPPTMPLKDTPFFGRRLPEVRESTFSGKLFAIEGADGSGRSTQIGLL